MGVGKHLSKIHERTKYHLARVRAGSFGVIHNHLTDKLGWYARWHQNPHASTVHKIALGFSTSVVALATLFSVGLIHLPVHASSGTGTEADPILISTPADLQSINKGLSKYYRLNNDINLAGVSFVPIGNSASPFTGFFDGNNKSIGNLTIGDANASTGNYLGLFGVVGGSSNVVIKNLTLVNFNITGNSVVGALAGAINNNTVITNASVSGGSVTSKSIAGGLIGYTSSSDKYPPCHIYNSKSSAAVALNGKGVDIVGGLIGSNYRCDISASSSSGNVSSITGSSAGGLIGYSGNSNIDRSFSTGSISSPNFSAMVGGLIGHSSGDNKVSNSYTRSAISTLGTDGSSLGVGGFIGYETGASTYQDNYSAGIIKVSDTANAGGFIGYENSAPMLRTNYWDSAVNSGTILYDVGSSKLNASAGKTTAALKIASTYSGWDFSAVWLSSSSSYPTLRPSPVTQSITVAFTGNGTVAPIGSMPVEYGLSKIFSIRADSGYYVGSIKINGVKQTVGYGASFTVPDITADTILSVQFIQNGTRYWDGGTSDTGSNWSTASNWSGNTVPGANDNIIFDNRTTKDCLISDLGSWGNNAANAHNLSIAGYTGTINSSAPAIYLRDFFQSSGTFEAGENNSLNITGSWNHSGGIFDSGSGRVVFTDGDSSVNISGDTVFNRLDFTTTVAKTIVFAAGSEQTVNDALTFTGAAPLITLKSSIAGTRWKIFSKGQITAKYVDVADSDNLSSAKVLPSNSIDAGNNRNWFIEKPQNLHIGSVGATSLTLDWESSATEADNVAYSIVNISSTPFNCAAAAYPALTDIPYSGLTLSATGLTPGSQYCIKAMSYFSAKSTYSAPVFLGPKWTLANTPSDITANSEGVTDPKTELKVSFNPNNSSPFVKYAIYNSTLQKYVTKNGGLQSGEDWELYPDWGDTPGVINGGLFANTSYVYTVKAENAEGVQTGSATSALVFIGDDPATLSALPVANSWDAQNGYSYKVNIGAGKNNPDGNFAIACDKSNPPTLFLNGNGTCTPAQVWKTKAQWERGTTNYIKDDGSGLPLAGDTKYGAYVLMKTASSSTIMSEWGTVPVAAPVALTSFSHAANTTSSISWKMVSINNPDGYIYYEGAKNVCSTTEKGRTSAFTQDYIETGLAPNTQYQRCVRAYRKDAADDLILGQPSPVVSVYTSIETPSLSFGAISADSIALSVGSLSNLTSGKSGLYFTTSSSNSGGDFGKWQSTGTALDSSLTSDTQYSYTVVARNGDGELTATSSSKAKYTLANPPQITSFSVTTSVAMLNFVQNGNPEITNYAIFNRTLGQYINAKSGGLNGLDSSIPPKPKPDWQSYNVWENSVFQNNGLTPNTAYTYSASSLNGDGQVATSSEATVTTWSQVPKIKKLAADYDSATGYRLSVSIDSNGNPVGTKYYLLSSTDNINFSNIGAYGALRGTPILTKDEFGWFTTQTDSSIIFAKDESGSLFLPNTQYYFQVAAYRAQPNDLTAFSLSAAIVTPPSAPTGLTTVSTCGSTATLTWNTVLGADKYNVSYGTDIDSSQKTIEASGVSQILSSLTANSNYHFKVQSVSNQNGAGPYSEIKNFTTATCQIAAPTDFKGKAISATEIDWSWSDNANNENGYHFVTSGASVDLPANSTSYSQTGLIAAIQYQAQIVAYDATAQVSSGLYAVYTLPNRAKAPIVTQTNSTTLSIKIDSTDDNPASLTRYAIYNDTLKAYTKQNGQLNGSDPDWQYLSDWHDENNNLGAVTAIDLLPDTSYTYKVIAENIDHLSTDLGSALSATSRTYPKYSVSATVDGNGTISPAGNTLYEHGNDINYEIVANDGYKIADVTDNDNSVGSVASYLIPAISANHTLKATFALLAPTGPGNVSLSATGIGKLSLAWQNNDSHLDNFNIKITAASDKCADADFSAAKEITIDKDATSTELSGLLANTRYCTSISAVNSAGSSAPIFSNARYTLIENPVISFGRITENSIALALNSASNLNNGASGLLVTTSNLNIAGFNSWTSEANLTDQNLAYNTAYQYRVKARNGDGIETDFSGIVTKSTLAFQPKILLVAGVTDSSINIKIDPSANSATTRYAIARLNADGSVYGYVRQNDHKIETDLSKPDWQTYSDWRGADGLINDGLTSDTHYIYAVKALNNDDIETSLSASVLANTLVKQPGKPIAVANSWSGNDGNSLTVSFDPNANTDTVQYAISCDSVGLEWLGRDNLCGDAQTWRTKTEWDNHLNVIKNLPSDSDINVGVVARNSENKTTAMQISDTVKTAPAKSMNLSHFGNTTGSIDWSWDANTSAPDGYRLYEFDGTSCTTNEKAETPKINIIENNLSGNTQYSRCLRAYRGNILGQPSAGISAYTSIETPTGISFDQIGNSSVALSATGTLSNLTAGKSGLEFTETTGHSGGGSDTGFSDWIQTAKATDSNLAIDQKYSYKVKARNGDGEETDFSSSADAMTTILAPVAPTVIAKSYNSVNITLNQDQNPASVRYAILDLADKKYLQFGQSGAYSDSADWQNMDKWNGTGGFDLPGLSPNTSYQFAVKAKGRDGIESAPVNSAIIFTLATSPGKPKVEQIDSNSLKISIDPGSNPTDKTEFAIFNETAKKYLTATGEASLDQAEWHILADWKSSDGSTGAITNKDLVANLGNSYQVIARNGDKILSEWSVSASNVTYPQYKVNVATAGNGQGDLSKSSQSIDRDSNFEVTATPHFSSDFVKWDGCDEVVGALCRIKNIEADKTITATFNLKKLNVTVNKSGEGDADFSQVTESVDWGTDLHITARPKDSSNFIRWDGCDSASGTTCSLSNITENKTVAAVLDLKQFDLTVKTVGCGSGGPTPLRVKYGGSSEQIFFTPNQGCELVQVAEGNQVWQPANDTYIATNVKSSHDVVGTFLKSDFKFGTSGFNSDSGYFVGMTIIPSQNPTETLYAVKNATTGQYVRQSDGAGIETADWQTLDKWGGANGFNAYGLKPNSSYQFEIKAKLPQSKETGWSPLQPSPITPAGPDGLFTVNSGNDWTNQPDVNITASGNAVTTKVQISNSADFSGAVTASINSATVWPLADSQSQGDKTIYLKFADNFGNQSAVRSKVIHYDLTPPAPLTGVTAIAGRDSVSLAWPALTESDVAKLIIYRSTDQNFTPVAGTNGSSQDYTEIAELAKDAGNTFFDNNNLKDGLTYYYRIIETDFAGNSSDPSLPVSARPDSTSPTAPQHIRIKDNSVTINNIIYTDKQDSEIDFDAATDAAGISGYTVKIGSASGSNSTQNIITAENKLAYKFPSDGNYYLRVSAKDAIGNASNDSPEQEVVVDTVAPVIPANSIQLEGANGLGVKMSWPKPIETGSGIAGYIIYKNDQPILNANQNFSSDVVALPDGALSYFDQTPIDKDIKYSIKVLDLATNQSRYDAIYASSQAGASSNRAESNAGQANISEVSASPKGGSAQDCHSRSAITVSIAWQTLSPMIARVEWGKDTKYGDTVALDTNFTYSHSADLNNLNRNTVYHYRVIGYDQNGNQHISNDYSFNTSVQCDYQVIGVNNSGQPVVLGITAKTAVPVTTTAAAVIASASAAAAPIANAATLFSLPEYLRSTIFSIVSFVTRRRRRNQGKVVEKETGLPLPQARLRLIALEKDVAGQLSIHRVVATAYSDKSGGFNFIAEPGRYIIEVNKDMYTHIMAPGFYAPSSVITVRSANEGLIIPIIALSMTKAQSSAKLRIIGRLHIMERWLVYISFLFLAFGTVSAVNALIHHSRDLLSVISLVVFPLLWYLNIKSVIRVSPWGDVVDRENHEGVSLALVRVTDESGQHLVRTTVTNAEGKFKTVVPKGRYKIMAVKPGYQQRQEIKLTVEEALDVVKKKIELDKVKL